MKVDLAILERCSKDDRRAQYDLYKSCFSVLMSVCVRYLNNQDDAKSMVNMGFLKIMDNLDKYKKEVPFEAWIRRIMLNTLIDEFRKNKKYKETIEYTDFELEEYNMDFGEDAEALNRMDVEDLEVLLEGLPAMSRQVFNLFAIDGYSHSEISKMLEMSEGTSKWHVSSARKILKEGIIQLMKATKILV